MSRANLLLLQVDLSLFYVFTERSLVGLAVRQVILPLRSIIHYYLVEDYVLLSDLRDVGLKCGSYVTSHIYFNRVVY